MKRIYDDTHLFYRILPKERCIELIVYDNDEKDIASLTEEDIISITFDEFLRETIEFQSVFPKIKPILLEQLKNSICSPKKSIDNITNLDKFKDNSNRILTYFLNRFQTLFPAEQSYTSKQWMNLWCYFLPKQESGKRIRKLVNNVEIVTSLDFFSRFYNITENEYINDPVFYVKKETGIKYGASVTIMKNNRPTPFIVSELSLVNLYYDLSYILFSLNESVCCCKYCNKPFFGKNGDSYCSSPSCQKERRRVVKNQKEVDRRHKPYKKELASVYNYISITKYNFKNKINNDTLLMSKFEEVEQVAKDTARNKLESFEIEGISPDDSRIINCIKSVKLMVYTFVHDTLEQVSE